MPEYQSLTDDFTQLKFDYVYIPACLLIAGTFVVKRDWTIYSVILSMIFGAYNFYQMRKTHP